MLRFRAYFKLKPNGVWKRRKRKETGMRPIFSPELLGAVNR